MSILPWDNWLYHTDERKAQLRNMYAVANQLNTSIKADIDWFNLYLAKYKIIATQNAALLIVQQISNFSDPEYQKFVQAVAALPEPVTGSVPIEVGSLITETVGSGLVLKALFNMASLAKDGLFGSAEGASESALTSVSEGMVEAGFETGGEAAGEIAGEALGETAAEGVGEAALADTGIGIPLAVGIDIFLGAFQGADEAKKLDQQLHQIGQTCNKLQQNSRTIAAKRSTLMDLILRQEGTFIALLQSLSKIAPAPITAPQNPSIADVAAIIGAQTMALHCFGPLADLRNTYTLAIQRNPNVTKSAIIQSVLMRSKTSVNEATLNKYWDVLASHSPAMQALKPRP